MIGFIAWRSENVLHVSVYLVIRHWDGEESDQEVPATLKHQKTQELRLGRWLVSRTLGVIQDVLMS